MRDYPRWIAASDVLVQVRQIVRLAVEHIRGDVGGVSSCEDSKFHHGCWQEQGKRELAKILAITGHRPSRPGFCICLDRFRHQKNHVVEVGHALLQIHWSRCFGIQKWRMTRTCFVKQK